MPPGPHRSQKDPDRNRPEEAGAEHADPVQEIPGAAGQGRRQGDRSRRPGGAEADPGGGHRQRHRHLGEQDRRPGISRLLRGGPDHDHRVHELPEGDPGRGHPPGRREPEKADVRPQDRQSEAKLIRRNRRRKAKLKMIGAIGII